MISKKIQTEIAFFHLLNKERQKSELKIEADEIETGHYFGEKFANNN